MRIDKIDFLRFLGLSLIILAHVQPPLWLAQLRNFDVPLMFMVMGMSFCVTEHRHSNRIKYINSRFRRLVLPTWIFFAAFFLINEIISFIFNIKDFTYNKSIIITSFALSSGLGYVWVIRLFFIISVIATFIPPKLYTLNLKAILTISASFLLINSQLIPLYNGIDKLSIYILLGTYISNSISYTLAFIIGYKIASTDHKELLPPTIICGLLFSGMTAYYIITLGAFNPTQSDKYPPGIYYMSYATFMIFVVYLLSNKAVLLLKVLRLWQVVSFISQNSIWIYLWHIPFIIMCQKIGSHYLISYVLTYTLATIMVKLQVSIVALINAKNKNKSFQKTFLSIFTG
ncbi:acyltransferase [Escherichia coli]|uniref:acyltransferase family protein n=1 Tax=Escherichia coli TaxID=562 RepID=UPI00140CB22C|nr:acyltransferase [Escherichia coli]MDC9043103.1 acyltransferase [Escherichia coli]NHR59497.1 acyltransferase [Escherichia coli]